MFIITLNAICVLLGSAIGTFFRKNISEKYTNVLNTAMGLCALTLGLNVAIANMQKSHIPVLFIFCLSLGGLLGTLLKLDDRMSNATRRLGSGNLSQGLVTAVLCCCVGTLAMMGPVMSVLYNDNTYLMTLAMLNFVTVLVLASTYGFGIALTAIPVFLWLSCIYGIAIISRTFISEELIAEVSIVGGIMIAAAGLGVLHIKDCKTINLLPSLFMPMLYFALKALLANVNVQLP